MPNQITTEGLETQTMEELVTQFTADFEEIYGEDIILDSDTPDGQMMYIFIQAVLDVLDLLTQIYNSFDPDNAVGTVLDQRVAINGIQRQAGTRTVQDVVITVDRALTLTGVDDDPDDPYTVQDSEGNQWQLISTRNPSSAGSYTYSFQAAEVGEVISLPNTITLPVTIVLGVTAINNPNSYTTLGINEETDATLKIRRQRSVALSSQGYLEGLLAALENINGVTFAYVYENVTGSTDANGVPGHSIWVIIGGTASDEDIATAIYRKRNAGCGTYGSESYDVTQPDGSVFTINWDVVMLDDLFIKFTVASIDGENEPNYQAIKDSIVENFVPDVNETVDINALATAAQEGDDNALITGAGFSETAGGTYTNTLEPNNPTDRWSVAEERIIILPVAVSPQDEDIATEATQQFTAVGGYVTGDYAWTIEVDNTGGSINASTGEYTAGSTPGTDTIRATDDLGNYGEADITAS